ncbi:MAG: hypothetical protein H6888_16010 [Nitratireductor sp.]|nr:hypothetical protein [Nitratireductor sp.]MCC0022570.1 hypothetical protein [Nitratireductor sp.]
MIFLARILLALQMAVIAAAIGAVVIFFGIIGLGFLTGSSNINGGLAMGAAGLVPAGAVAGAIVGVILALKFVPRMDGRSAAAAGYGITLVAALSVGGWFAIQELTDGNPYEAGKEPVLHVEWRIPETFPHQHVDRVFRHMMRSTWRDWTLSTWWDEPRARDEDGHTILRFAGEIRWREKGRVFQFWRAPYHDDRITVELGLPDDPPGTEEYGPWREVETAPGNAFRVRVER